MSSRLEKRSYKSRATFDPITPSQVMQPFTPLFIYNSYKHASLQCCIALHSSVVIGWKCFGEHSALYGHMKKHRHPAK